MDLNTTHAAGGEPTEAPHAAGTRAAPRAPWVLDASARRAPDTRSPRGAVHVEIGTLVLEGFGARTDPDQVTAAFRAELTRLVERDGVPLAADGTGHGLEALTGLPRLPATASPDRIGVALARAVHAGLSGHGTEPARRGGASDRQTGTSAAPRLPRTRGRVR